MQLSPGIDRQDFFRTFLMVVIYALGFYGLQFFLHETSLAKWVPDAGNICYWDGGWYKSIIDRGYQYTETDACNTGFYFLFPFIWKILHLGNWGVSFLNIGFFAAGFSLLSSLYKPSVQEKLMWLSVPTVYFAFVPYSEALFFLLSAVMIYGIKTGNRPTVWISLFLLSLTRSTGLFLAPALLVMCLVSNDRRYWYKGIFRFVTDYLAPMAAGLILFAYIQFRATGIWFAYFRQQATHWDRKFNWPVLPFDSLTGPPTLWFSALAMFAGFFCFLALVAVIVRWLFRNRPENDIYTASLGYLFMALVVVVFYNPTWVTSTTNVSGAFRYTFMNPYFYVVLAHFSNRQYNWKHFLGILLLSNAAWLAFGSYKHIMFTMYFEINTLIILLFMLFANRKTSWPVLVLTAINLFFQIQFFQLFIGNNFPD